MHQVSTFSRKVNTMFGRAIGFSFIGAVIGLFVLYYLVMTNEQIMHLALYGQPIIIWIMILIAGVAGALSIVILYTLWYLLNK